MEQKKPKEDNSLKDLLKETNNEDSVKLVNYIQGKLNVSEFKVAEKLGLSVNQVRNMLYKLHEYNLVYSVRKKDNSSMPGMVMIERYLDVALNGMYCEMLEEPKLKYNSEGISQNSIL